MVLGWLTRLTVALVVLAIIAFDGVSIITAKVGVKDDAQNAASAAAAAYQRDHDAASVLAAAKQALGGGDKLVPNSIKVSPSGAVTLKVRRTASSIVLHLWSTTARWDDVSASATETAPTL